MGRGRRPGPARRLGTDDAAGPAVGRKEEVHVEGESHGHRYSLDSELRIDEGDRRLDWGAEGDYGYRGSLQVAERPSGSEAHLHVVVPDDRLGPSPDSAAAEIRRGMEETFDRLAGLIAT